MREVFADTFYWVALTNPNDSRYQDALAFDEVLSEATIMTTGLFFGRAGTLRGTSRQAVQPGRLLSMQTMRKEGLPEVLTNDRHFEQEGFRTLFRDS